jgi:RND family efflux transporter MFP subunit
MKKILAVALTAISAFAYNLVPAETKTIDITKTYSGDIYAKNQVMVATRLMGYIKKMNVEEGDVVHKGDILFEVDPSDIYSMINQARAGVMQAQNGVLMAKLAYADAEKDYQRFKNLYEKGAVSKRDFEKMKLNMQMRSSQIKLAEAMLEQAKAGLQRALDQKKYAKVKAPIDGVVVRKMTKVAEMAIPGHPVIILADLNSIQARAFVKEGDVKVIHKDQDAKVYVSAVNKTVDAKVSNIIPSADPATHSYLVKFSLADKEGLLPGMYAKIYVKIASKQEVVVPYNALTSRGGIVGVFVDNNGKAKFIPVSIVSQDGEEVAVTGVNAGERVVILPPANMTDSTPLN